MYLEITKGLPLASYLQSKPEKISISHIRISTPKSIGYCSLRMVEFDASGKSTLGKKAELRDDKLIKLGAHQRWAGASMCDYGRIPLFAQDA